MNAHRARMYVCLLGVLAAGLVPAACAETTSERSGGLARGEPAEVGKDDQSSTTRERHTSRKKVKTTTSSDPRASTATTPGTTPPTPESTTTLAEPQSHAARQMLDRIPIRNEHQAGYERRLFDPGRDADGDGCTTRAEVLLREAGQAPSTRSGCALSGGAWQSLLDAATVRGAAAIEVDHVVSLKEAWDSGAWRWTAHTRAAFANDLTDERTLQPLTAHVNRSKGDRDPSNWLPPDADAVCTYIGDWVAIKARWKLSMDESEWGRVKNLLEDECSGHRIARWRRASVSTTTTTTTTTTITTTRPPPPPPQPPPPTTVAVLPVLPQPSPGCDPSYTGCVPVASDVDCAGGSGNGPAYVHGPVEVIGGDPYGLDADGDGIGCED